MIIPNINRVKGLLFQKKYALRPIFGLTNIFNKVDVERIKQFGPDRVCAEWCLKNGASILWVDKPNLLTDYNSLPPEGTQLYIQKIDATNSSLSHVGFLHLRGCNYIQEIILNNCLYIENDALNQLSFVKSSLEHLQVSKCGNITDAGLLYLKDLSKLKTLGLFRLMYVKDKKNIIQILKEALPNCEIKHDFDEKKK